MKLLLRISFLFTFIVIGKIGLSQNNLSSDTTKSKLLIQQTPKHSPKIAGYMSAAIPGLGQAYNKKYWKIPIIYAGFGVLTYFIINNNKNYHTYLTAYKTRLDDDPSNDLLPQYTSENLIIIKNYYWKNRDLSILLTGAFYALNILDAVVDAHFYTYDISDNLSLQIRPQIETMFVIKPIAAPVLNFSLNF